MLTLRLITQLMHQHEFIKNRRNFIYRRVRKGCECPEPKPKVHIEKSCEPCSFKTWKPKTKACRKAEIQYNQGPKMPMACYPGMVITPPVSERDPNETNPFKGRVCLDCAPKIPPPKKEPKFAAKIPIPKPDWVIK